MTPHIQNIHTIPTKHALRTVVVVSEEPHEHVLDSLRHAADYDVIFVESPAHAYSRIKHVSPQLVIVCLSTDDMNGFQVLSMLKLDRETSRIPVVTFTVERSHGFGNDSGDGSLMTRFSLN
jgi:CheY-like chemotaxis protein